MPEPNTITLKFTEQTFHQLTASYTTALENSLATAANNNRPILQALLDSANQGIPDPDDLAHFFNQNVGTLSYNGFTIKEIHILNSIYASIHTPLTGTPAP